MPFHRPTRSLFSQSKLILCVLCASSASPSFAGPLTPPAGPITPTPGPEPRTAINTANTPGDADSVFRISQPGSYYLTANLIGESGKHGIEIATDGVTIDLNGFSLLGVGGTLDGVTTAGAPRVRIQVRNGTIGAFGTGGIDLAGSGHFVESCQVRVCGTYGINIGSGTVADCSSGGNTGPGFRAQTAGVFENCVAESNTDGFLSGPTATFRGCIARANTADGFNYHTTGSAVFENCTADSNGDIGFHGFGSYSYHNCTARQNGGTGFFIGQEGASLTNCVATGNTFDGIFVLTGSVISCTSRQNDGRGIECLSGIVADCDALSNTDSGIYVESNSVVARNRCTGNGAGAGDGAGIEALFSDNRIEGNNCADNDRGIDIVNSGNIILRNTCSGNTINYVVVANNYYGPIIDRTGAATAAVSGSAAASTLGSTDANANYSY